MRKLFLMMCVALLSGLLAASPAVAEIIIYADDFSGDSSTNLSGQAPDTRPGSETWTASATNPPWKADGSIGTFAGGRNAFLPFVPVDDKVYTLSLDLNLTGGGSGDWFAMGFAQYNVADATFTASSVNGWAYMLHKSPAGTSNHVQTFTGPAGTGYEGSYDVTGTALKVVLDTQPDTWTAEWFLDGSSLRGPTDISPTINYVGFGRCGTATGSVDNFELTVIPEPSTLVLLGISALALLLVLRRRR